MNVDLLIIILFFCILLISGFLPSVRKAGSGEDEFLLAGRTVRLWPFIMTNVASWYGGILGVGEFSYRYGLVNWFTQGVPYYLFSILFAVFFIDRIKSSSAATIPTRIEQKYGRQIGLLSACFVFILTSPAPYLFMAAIILSHLFPIGIVTSSIIISVIVGTFLIWGGFKSDVYTDIFQFFVMFAGFFVILAVLVPNYGGLDFLKAKLPASHFTVTGGNSVLYVIVWWLIALWTFVDPGFYQRTQSAISPKVAKQGIIISVLFFFIFDFLTNSVGLYSRALFPNLAKPSESFLVLADSVLGTGLRGFFYAAMFATILSTLNCFLFISATTFSYDVVKRLVTLKRQWNIRVYITIGIILSAALSIVITMKIPSVIDIWYTLGSLVLPGLFFPLIGTYFDKFSVSRRLTLLQMILSESVGVLWYLLKNRNMLPGVFQDIEPMLIGIFAGLCVLIPALIKKRLDLGSKITS
jgi:SSS family solute:Na+ symporter